MRTKIYNAAAVTNYVIISASLSALQQLNKINPQLFSLKRAEKNVQYEVFVVNDVWMEILVFEQ